jgi:type III pantothenate kinase
MMLCIDAGNTRIKWGVHDGRAWTAHGVAGHDALDRLDADWDRLPAVRAIAVSNVAGGRVHDEIERHARRWAVPVRWLQAEREAGGVRNLYDEPAQLGVDRWAAVVAARALVAGDCLVVIAGTATTLNLLRGDGTFRGGVIIPGGALMKQTLAANTAKLPLAAGSYRDEPRNTADAIESGCLHAQCGAIERMHRQLAPGAACLLSGGFAEVLLPRLGMPARYVEHLVLDGVRLLGAAR